MFSRDKCIALDIITGKKEAKIMFTVTCIDDNYQPSDKFLFIY